jgi:uncharacterized protein YjbI with pentapeptide repeats
MAGAPPVLALGPVACGAIAWRRRGALHVSVAVKATFALVPGAAATIRAPVDLVRADVSFDRDPAQSLERAADLVPFRPQCDVTFVGHAYAPPGRPAPAMSVRLAVYREGPLVERTLHVFGDRAAGAPGQPAPFPRMPIRYERGAPSASSALPNLVDPARPDRPAGFGPRRSPLAGLLAAPIVDLPDDVTLEAFQSAPEEQRAPHLRGDEWIVLDGLHPVLPRVQTQLPSARGAARIFLEGGHRDLEMVADTLIVDGDAQCCAVVWRALVPVPGEEALRGMRIAGGLELPGQLVAWPEIGAGPAGQPIAANLASTVGMSAERQKAVAVGPATPFSAPREGAARPSEAPAATPAALRAIGAPQRPSADLGSTVGLSFGEQRAVVRRAVTPFEGTIDAPLDGPTVGALPPPEVVPDRPPPATPPPGAPGGGGPPAEVPPRTSPAIPVLSRTPLVLVTMPWQVRPPKDSLTVVVKGTFDLVPDAPAMARDPMDLPTGDVHEDGDTAKSLSYASDFAIFKPRADLLVRGSAHGGASGVTQVRFSFGREGSAIERRIAVFGDRRWRTGLGGSEPTAPEPFDAIPLVYERAFGGAKVDENPLGAGRGGERLPNLEDPAHLVTSPRDAPPPACFAPIPVLWKERRSKLGTYDARWLETRWPYFPEDFDWAHFQAAPRAQQIAYPAGDEPFEIAGMRREAPVLRGSLPGLRPRCVLAETREAGGALREVNLRLDTVAFDVEAMKLSLVWRGVVEVRDDEASEIAALLLIAEPMASPHATLEQIRDACLAARLPPAQEPPAPPPANDAAPAPDPEEAKLRADLDARLAEARAQLRKAGIDVPAATDPPAAPPAMPPMPDPASIAASLRTAGASEKEVEDLIGLLRKTKEAEAAGGGAPASDRRARVVAMLEEGASFEGMDLAGMDLAGLDFGGRVLVRANLKGARLAGCNLSAADLGGAQVGGADLAKANLDAANLAGADLHEAVIEGASLEGASLDGARFDGAKGEGASFRGAKGASASFAGGAWARARFDEARLPSADFTRAKLDGASFAGAVMPEVRLFDATGVGARFDGAMLAEARADGASLTECSFAGVDATRSTWEKAALDGSSFRAGKLAGASFVRASGARSVFTAAHLRQARFSRAKLPDAKLLKADLMKAALDRADLTRADLRGASLHAAETWKAKLDGAMLDLAIVTQSKLKERA